MLEHLEIRNFALIENLCVDFSEGFNVITGETGSGKSIILGALGLLMGEKADTGAVRSGAEEIVIDAVLSVPEGHEILPWLSERGVEPEDGVLYIRRTVKANGGRSLIHVQNQLFSRQDLEVLADSIMDMHGQSEHQSLLKADRQRKILDSYAGDSEVLASCASAFRLIGEVSQEIVELEEHIEEGRRQQDYLQFALDEIENARVVPGEDEGHMNSVGNHLDSHVFEQINAFHSSGMLELTHVVETGHGVIEVCSHCIAGIPGGFDMGIFGSRVSDSGHNAFAGDIFAHLHSAWQLGGGIPSAHAVKVLNDVDVFVGVRNADDFRHLGTGFARVEIWPLHVHSHDGRIGSLHQFITGLARLFHHVDGGRRKGGIDGRCAVPQVGQCCCLKGFSCAFLEVTASTAMAMQVDAARHHMHAVGINSLVHALQLAAALAYLLDA